MTKRRVIHQAEIEPEPIDFDDPMNPALREFANELQGLKSYCVDHDYDFEEATHYYQDLLAQSKANPNTAGDSLSLIQALRVTMEHVCDAVASRGLMEPSHGDIDVVSELRRDFDEQIAAIGFPKDRAEVILEYTMKAILPEGADPYEVAYEAIAREMRSQLEAQEAEAHKLTVAVGSDGKARVVEKGMVSTHEERIRKVLGGLRERLRK